MLSTRPRNTTSHREEDTASSQAVLPRFGVALFDDSRDSGWACLPDGEPFRFRKPEDLRNDSIWVCSSDGMDYSSRWGKMHHMRPADYISKLTHIAADYGLRLDGQGKFGSMAKQAAQVLAPTIHRAMVIAAQIYGWKNPEQMLRSDSLIDDVRKYLTDVLQPPPVQNHMRGALASAFQTFSSVNWASRARMEDSVVITLRYNRLEYAQRIMNTLVPDGAWSYQGEDMTPGFKYPLERALDPEAPCLVNATVEFSGQDQEIASLCAFGSQPSSRPVLRSWISQPELRWISQHAHVNINAIRFTNCAQPLPRKLLLPELLTSDPLFQLSVSAGLVAEAHWKSLAKDVYKPSVEGKKEVSPWAVWLRAADRGYSFELALAAHKRDFYVLSYGNGSAIVSCPRSRLPDLLEFSMENNVAHPAFRTIFIEHGLIKPDGTQ